MSGLCVVRFLPDKREATVEQGATVSDAATCAEVLLEHPCGGRGRCGKCRVRIVEGAPAPSEADGRALSAQEIEQGWRLACRTRLNRSATIEVPPASRAIGGKTFGGDDLFPPDFERAFTVTVATLDTESLDGQLSLLERLGSPGEPPRVPASSLSVVRELARLAAARTTELATVWEEDELRAVLDTQSAESCLGVAVDLGTTTVAAALVDLRTGATRAIHSTLNRQVRFGADVVSRITHTIEKADGTAALQRAAVDTISEAIDALCRQARVDRREILGLSVVGNSTMEHLLLGVSPASLGLAPYVGAWRGERSVAAAELGFDLRPEARIWVSPMVRSNVGGDAVAAMLATAMDRDPRLRLLIDLGTNAEVVLGSAQRRLACSTAAGPAFEGANISQGMRAAPGAVDFFAIHDDGQVAWHVLGDAPARGVCGSGLLDAVAALRRVGAIDGRGWLQPPQDGRAVPEPVLGRFAQLENGMNAFTLVSPDEGENGRPVVLTAGDVRQLQLVKGSIAAGTAILCREMGVVADEIEEVLIAGAFGNYVRKSSALGVGLVPPLEPERVRFVGNAAGIGARMILADRDARRRALTLADETEYLELAGRADYQNAFATAMLFDA